MDSKPLWLHMSVIGHIIYTKQERYARRFVEEIFNARKTEMAKNFVTPDIIYHGMGEEVRGLEEFKRLHIAQRLLLPCSLYYYRSTSNFLFLLLSLLEMINCYPFYDIMMCGNL